MTEYTNLNEIVQDYKISKSGDIMELRALQKQLSNVPVLLNWFEKYMNKFGCEISNLITRAEFVEPFRIYLLEELVEDEEADELMGKMIIPFPRIIINGDIIAERFYNNTKSRLGELIVPDKRDETSRVLSSPKNSSAALIYERGKKVHYIEIGLTRKEL